MCLTTKNYFIYIFFKNIKYGDFKKTFFSFFVIFTYFLYDYLKK